MSKRSYLELKNLKTFEERFEYLRLSGRVGKETFGGRRALNQRFYSSQEWRRLRRDVIVRDSGCDLGIPGYEIFDRIYIHHIIPIRVIDLQQGDYRSALDINNLITVSSDTHERIHYGSEKPNSIIQDRTQGDTTLW